MNQHVYCHNCGSKLSLASKFCGQCGTNLSSLSSTPEKKTNNPIQRPLAVGVQNEEDEDSNYLDKIEHLNINLSALEVELPNMKRQKESLGSLVANPIDPRTIEQRPSMPNVTKEQVLEEFKKEAGTSAHRINIG
jgi:hypothetical protein